jgi:hypothetical protein
MSSRIQKRKKKTKTNDYIKKEGLKNDNLSRYPTPKSRKRIKELIQSKTNFTENVNKNK